MKYSPIIGLVLAMGCSKPAAQGPEQPKSKSVAELAALMKNEINPQFSRLMFLLFHGDTVEDDKQTVRAEMQRSATALRTSIGRLRTWEKVPAESSEARDVFYTFAESVDLNTLKLVQAIDRGDDNVATRQLEQIADTCNNCHHFFRLDIEDSKVGPKQAATLVQLVPTGSP